ncbi:MAG: glycosyltransferase family 2 protein [Gaiellaceae bacterium]|jgi:hypothetical protein
MIQLSIIIVNCETDALLGNCLRSIQKHARGVDYEIIVVNTRNTDPRGIVSQSPRTKLIESRNDGFGAANNRGAGEASGNVLFLLNSDAELAGAGIDDAVASFGRSPELGLLVPRLELPDGSPQTDTFGPMPTVLGTLLRLPGRSTSRHIRWVTAAALFIPRNLFERLGGFDERFFMYFEDVDLGARATAAGYRAAYFPGLRVLHHGGASSGGKRARTALYAQSQTHFFRKHYGRRAAWIIEVARVPRRLAGRR